MELEALKKSWESLGKRMQNAAALNQKLVETIISSRIMTTVDKIKRLYAFFYLILAVEAVVLIAIFLGNPFDFKNKLQFIPYGLILIGVIITFFNLLYICRSIQKLSPEIRIDHYLKGIVSVYDQKQRF